MNLKPVINWLALFLVVNLSIISFLGLLFLWLSHNTIWAKITQLL